MEVRVISVVTVGSICTAWDMYLGHLSVKGDVDRFGRYYCRAVIVSGSSSELFKDYPRIVF